MKKAMMSGLLWLACFGGLLLAQPTTYDIVEEMPRFPCAAAPDMEAEALRQCSEEALLAYVYGQVYYPAAAREAGAQGTVVARFVVDEQGRVGEASIVRSPHPSLDTVVLAMVAAMPAWTPGRMKGEAVRVAYSLPVRFRLEDAAPDLGTPREAFTEMADLFCLQYMGEIIPVDVLRALADKPLDLSMGCGLGNTAAQMKALHFTLDRGGVERHLESTGDLSAEMRRMLAELQVGDALSIEFEMAYQLGELVTTTEEFRVLIAE